MPSLDDLYRKIYLHYSFGMFYLNFKLVLEKSGTKFLTNLAIFFSFPSKYLTKGSSSVAKMLDTIKLHIISFNLTPYSKDYFIRYGRNYFFTI